LILFIVFAVKVPIEKESPQPNLAGQPGHVQTIDTLTGNERQGCLCYLLPPHSLAKSNNTHNRLIMRMVIKLLAADTPLPYRNFDHPLSGDWADHRDPSCCEHAENPAGSVAGVLAQKPQHRRLHPEVFRMVKCPLTAENDGTVEHSSTIWGVWRTILITLE
jgi:hypothetical protein